MSTENETLQKEVLDKFAHAHYNGEPNWQEAKKRLNHEYGEYSAITTDEVEELVALAIEMANKDMIAKLQDLYFKENLPLYRIIERLKKSQGQEVNP